MAYYEFSTAATAKTSPNFSWPRGLQTRQRTQASPEAMIVRAKTGEAITLSDVRRAHDAYRPRDRVAAQRRFQHQGTSDRVGADIEIDAGNVEADEKLDEKG